MKSSICALVVFVVVAAQAAILPERLQVEVCKKSDIDYQGCLRKALEKVKPYFLEGVPELGFPKIDPLVINETSLNRKFNDMVSIKAVFRDVVITGLKDTIVEDIKADPFNLVKEVRFTIPHLKVWMSHYLSGKLFSISLASDSIFEANFTDIKIYTRVQLRRYLKDDIEYFAIKKLDTKFQVGDGVIKFTSKDPQFQFAADIITDYFNSNPRIVMDAINPLYNEFFNEMLHKEIDSKLANIPASELLPE